MNSNTKPAYLTASNAARFEAQSVAERYGLRLPHSPQTFDILDGLITDQPRTLLDIGTGTGEIARTMAGRMARVDANDMSAAMIAYGKTQPGGDAPNLRWLLGRAEDVALDPPYALITAGDSLHWMDWDAVLPRLARALTPHGYLALVHRVVGPTAWREGLGALIQRYSTIKNFENFDLIAQLEGRGLYTKIGATQTTPIAAAQSIDDYIAGQHSQSSLSLDAMSPADAAAFDAELRMLVTPYADPDGMLGFETIVEIEWGKPR